MIIEAEKIKRLTEKLREQGDISEDEADYIYMLRRIFIFYNLHRYSYPLTEQIIKSCFMNMGDTYLESISEAFEDWYKAVRRLINKGKSGNFVSTVAVKSHFFTPVDYELKGRNKKISRYMYEIVKNMPETDKIIEFAEDEIFSGNLLSLDVVNHKALRYGLARRIENKSPGPAKDVLYLHNISKKLRKTGDISFEEANMVYTIFKYAQSLRSMIEIYYCFKERKQFEPLDDAVYIWFRSIRERIRRGKRSGNYLYTIPLSGYSMFKAKNYIKNTLEKLTDCEAFVFLMDKNDIKTLFLDVSQKDDEISSCRYGAIRSNVNLDNMCFFPCTESSAAVDSWMRLKKGKYYRRDSFINYSSRKCYGIVGKLEYLAEKGVLPVGMMTDSLDRNYIAFYERDRDIVTQVMSIPDKIIEDNTPAVKDQNDEDAVRRSIETSKIFVDLFVQSKVEREKDPDDEWLVIDR